MKMFLASPGKHCCLMSRPITKLCQHSEYLKVSWKHCLCSTSALIEYIVHHGYIGLGPRSIEPLCQPQKLVQSWSLTHKEPITAIDPKLRNLGGISFILLQNSPNIVQKNSANGLRVPENIDVMLQVLSVIKLFERNFREYSRFLKCC